METILISIPFEDFEKKLREIIISELTEALNKREPKKFYTLKEAAVRTNKATSTLYTHACQGKLAFIKSGRQLRFTEEQLVAYLEGKR